MKLYKTTINPISDFATTIKGDTLFGQICWAIKYKYGQDKLEHLLSNYDSMPFLIVSDGFAKGYLPKPHLPSSVLGENIDEKKINRKKIWLTIENLQNGKFLEAKTDNQVKNIDSPHTVVRNSINYNTFTTDDSGDFTPYGENEYFLSLKDIYFLIDEKFSLNELRESFMLLSQIGYGKDASIGKGRFEFSDFMEVKVNVQSNTFITLSPSCLFDTKCEKSFYESFTRFGKHGGNLANKNPFKRPILLADTAAVLKFEKDEVKQYIGKAIKGHSKNENTVHQGYSIVIPIKGI